MGAYNQVDVEEAKKAIDAGACTIVDIRDPGSFEVAHIEGAVHLNDATVDEFLRHTDRRTPVLVYCYHGNSSRNAAAWLVEQGFETVSSMIGGFEEWRGRFPAG